MLSSSIKFNLSPSHYEVGQLRAHLDKKSTSSFSFVIRSDSSSIYITFRRDASKLERSHYNRRVFRMFLHYEGSVRVCRVACGWCVVCLIFCLLVTQSRVVVFTLVVPWRKHWNWHVCFTSPCVTNIRVDKSNFLKFGKVKSEVWKIMLMHLRWYLSFRFGY